MTKLSDTQRVILSAAAQHEMGLARAPKTLSAAARNAVFRSLIKNNLLTEINAPRDYVGLGWRQDDDGTWIVARIPDEGLRAIGIDPNEGDAVADTAPTAAPDAEPAPQDALAAEGPQATPLTEEISLLDQALAAPAATPRANLRDAATAILATWDDEANREGDIIGALDAPMETLRKLLAGKPARPHPSRARRAAQAARGHEAGAGAGHAAPARGRHRRADRRGHRLGAAHRPRILRGAEEEGPRGRGEVARADGRPQQDRR